MHSTFNLPIWVTEWACQNYNNGPQCSSDSVAAFMNQTQSFMDQTDWVERYSWFGAMENMQGVNQVRQSGVVDRFHSADVARIGQRTHGQEGRHHAAWSAVHRCELRIREWQQIIRHETFCVVALGWLVVYRSVCSCWTTLVTSLF
jgi:hypothetical protein